MCVLARAVRPPPPETTWSNSHNPSNQAPIRSLRSSLTRLTKSSRSSSSSSRDNLKQIAGLWARPIERTSEWAGPPKRRGLRRSRARAYALFHQGALDYEGEKCTSHVHSPF